MGILNKMLNEISGFVDALKDLIVIYTWKETWVAPFAALGIVAVWSTFAFAFFVPNPWRSMIVWGLFLGLTVGAAAVHYMQKWAKG